ncbi:MAG: class I SAM-dependent methyltransferase [Dehalococcoidia bacterium]
MPITRVRGKQLDELSGDDLRAMVAGYARVVVDLGTGDGRFAYHYAKAHPDAFVIAIDPVRENMREFSARASGKPARGGLPNILYAVASVEMLPPELCGLAGELHVVLPWGSLMRGLVLGDEVVLGGVASLLKTRGTARIVLNTRIFEDPVPLEARDLPEVTPAYVRERLAPRVHACGLVLREAREFTADEVAALPSTWAKRLSHRTPPPSVLIVLERERDDAG